jgi:hypothetical protein
LQAQLLFQFEIRPRKVMIKKNATFIF